MSKKSIPVYQVAGEYADCLEKAFAPTRAAATGTASDGAAALVAGGAMGNTPHGSSRLGTISEDTAHISLWADFGAETETFFGRLERCQNESRRKAENAIPEETDDGDSIAELDFDPDKIEGDGGFATRGQIQEHYIEGNGSGYIEFGGHLWKVMPRGIGGGDGRAYYPYVMASGGVIIAVRRKQSETVSNMWVECGSIVLARNGGLAGLWVMLGETFQSEGITIHKDILSRVDIYADFGCCDVSAFCEKMETGSRVCRARSLGFFAEDMNVAMYFSGKRHTGFSIGKNIKLRIYDKRREMEKDPIKWGVFQEKYGEIPEEMTRVEFQLRRRALAEFYLTGGTERIDGVESYLAARDRLWTYLTEDWFRLTEKPVDAKNKHQAHSVVWSVWERVQSAVSVAVKEVFRIRRQVEVDMSHLATMALGCICKIAVWEDRADDWKGITGAFMRYVKTFGWSKIREVIEKHSDDKVQRVGGFSENSCLITACHS